MAYAVIVSLAQTINQILNHDQTSISLHQKQQMKSINEQIILLQAFLEDFPEKTYNSFEGRIMDVANEAEDIIEYFMWGKLATSCGHHCYDLHELKKVADEIDSIAVEVMNIKNSFRIREILTVDSPPPPPPPPPPAAASSSSRVLISPSNEKDNAMVGFDDDLMAIKERLCGESSKLQFVPIVGMGGIGKTTLAQNAYRDPLIIERFQIRAWVTVSQDYSEKEICLTLLDSMKEFNVERSNQSNEVKVYKILKRRKYLIVMDDIWSTKAWDDVKMIFPDDNNGSRIMLTTRLTDVAAYANSSSPLHKMHLMDVDRSWDLLRQKVFMDKDCPPELKHIGKMIARSCRGLPLAIVVIAGLLSTVSKTRGSWEEIAQNVKLAIATKGGQFEKILSLSYTHLPHHLRLCFLYMGGFPENYKIHVSKLIKLWVAEGFLKPSESRNSEEMAVEYLEDLVKRSLVFVDRRKPGGQIKSCRVHDLVRDLCIRKAEEVKLFHLVDKSVEKVLPESIKYQRRLCIANSDPSFLATINGFALRTIICFRTTGTSLGYLRNFRLLWILDAVDANVEYLPVEVFKLFRLRYLALCYDKAIPAAISNLQNLQTLIICPNKNYSQALVVYLPLEIWWMRQLRHLVSPFSVLVADLEDTACALENLTTLSISADVMCTTGILEMIPNLKKLEISYFGGNVDNNYHLDDLVHLHQLEKLKLNELCFRRGKFDPAFPRTLKKLTLSGWRLPWDDMGIVGSLPNLQVLKLRDSAFYGYKWETNDGEFPQLKFLLIKESYLQSWITDSSHFPCLVHLLLHDCQSLRGIPDGIGEIPTLELIEVKGDNRSLMESAKRIQEEQRSWGNDALEVRFDHPHSSFSSIFEKVRLARSRNMKIPNTRAEIQTLPIKWINMTSDSPNSMEEERAKMFSCFL